MHTLRKSSHLLSNDHNYNKCPIFSTDLSVFDIDDPQMFTTHGVELGLTVQ